MTFLVGHAVYFGVLALFWTHDHPAVALVTLTFIYGFGGASLIRRR